MGWIIRFIEKSRKRTVSNEPSLTVEENLKAENALWGLVQRESFLNYKDLRGLVVVRGETDLLHVKTKIVDRQDDVLYRYPLLLPAKHHLVNCLIWETHVENCHTGGLTLVAILREKYWILSSRRAVRRVVAQCGRCRRYAAKAASAPPIALPLDRVRDSAVFEVTGVDLCGPLYLRSGSKVWIALFTCAVYRAVHLELVSALSTETFLQALRRFIARRGRPRTIYSDNGTNFVGAGNLFQQVDWGAIASATRGCIQPITWKFNPPTAAWWGGWWERLIRSLKDLLLRCLGKASLKYEELATLLCDAEWVMNERPLTYSSETGDLVPLTPAMFLRDLPAVGVPDLDQVDTNSLQLRVRHCQKLRDELRRRFRLEYLGQLVQMAKLQPYRSLAVGDIVLVHQNTKRLLWPVAKVLETFPGRDGHIRVAKVKTKDGVLTRPVQKLYPLELQDKRDTCPSDSQRSNFGRRLIQPERFQP